MPSSAFQRNRLSGSSGCGRRRSWRRCLGFRRECLQRRCSRRRATSQVRRRTSTRARSTCLVPSVRMRCTSESGWRRLSNTILRPSGDQRGSDSLGERVPVRFRCPEPSLLITYRSNWRMRSLPTNAILVPSGDQTGDHPPNSPRIQKSLPGAVGISDDNPEPVSDVGDLRPIWRPIRFGVGRDPFW